MLGHLENLVMAGRPDEAIDELETPMRLEPDQSIAIGSTCPG